MKVLINVPRLGLPGGVANYYSTLRLCLDDQKIYFEIGAKNGQSGMIGSLRRLIADYIAFYRRLGTDHIDLVHLNPSLVPGSVLRDGLFLLIAKVRRKKVLVFFRGWDKNFEAKIRHRYRALFAWVYGRADAFIVLAEEFRDVLRDFGLTAPVWLDTTVVSNQVLRNVDERDRSSTDRVAILYMSRIEKDKGCATAIRAFSLLRQGGIDGQLIIAGDGALKQAMESLTEKLAVPDVKFVGHITGEEKVSVFLSADVFLFPSAYAEGMPNTVLEAMGYGLPVVTRPVGGLRDFFEDGDMGYISDSREPEVFAGYLRRLAMDPELREKIGRYNHEYAETRFSATRVAERLQLYYERTVDL